MIALVAAVAKNNCIGKNNRLPWHIPEDMQYFKKLTSGKIVLMGRKTFESILGYLGKPLPERLNIVITRDSNYINKTPAAAQTTSVIVYNNISDALKAHSQKDIYIIGGAEIYKQTIDLADKLYITRVEQEVAGDVFFPKINKAKWRLTSEDKKDGYSFLIYVHNN